MTLFNLDEYADISRVIREPEYAQSKHLLVKKCKSTWLQFLEQQLRQLSVKDEHFHTHMARIKMDMTEEKNKDHELYIIKYDKQYITQDNVYTLGQFRSVIVDHEKVVCFSPPKAISYTYFRDMYDGGADNGVKALEFVEGTMINVFYDTREKLWEIATRGNIGGHYKYYQDHSKTFRTMFLEAADNSHMDFPNTLDKQYCYSFVLQHPENRIVVSFTNTKLVLTNMYKCNKYKVEALPYEAMCTFARSITGIELPPFIRQLVPYDYYNLSNWKALFDKREIGYNIMGAIFLHPSGTRTKIRNPNYEYVRSLKGNSPKLQYQYYHLRQTGNVKEFLTYYPEYKKKCGQLRQQLHTWTFQLYTNYVRCYMKKEKPLGQFPKEFRNHMFLLHQIYLTELIHKKRSITRQMVIDYVNKLEPARLMYAINYKLREQYLEENKQKQQIR